VPSNQPSRFQLTGGALCLDFANTVFNRPVPERRQDHLHSYADLLDWSRQTGLVLPQELAVLLHAGARHAQSARRVLRRATQLREVIFAVFSAIAAGQAPAAADLHALNTFLIRARKHRRLEAMRDGFRWKWICGPNERLERPLWEVVESTTELLTSDRLRSVRQCRSETCAWLFLDTSRSQTRSWCEMRTCGNRAKARRFYDRIRA